MVAWLAAESSPLANKSIPIHRPIVVTAVQPSSNDVLYRVAVHVMSPKTDRAAVGSCPGKKVPQRSSCLGRVGPEPAKRKPYHMLCYYRRVVQVTFGFRADS